MKVASLVLLTLNLMRLAAYQPCIRLISDWSRVQSLANLIALKNVMSATNRYLYYYVAQQSSLMKILKSRGPRTNLCETPERISKDGKRVSNLLTEDAD